MVIETGEKKLICIGVHASCQSKVSPGPQAPHFESHPSQTDELYYVFGQGLPTLQKERTVVVRDIIIKAINQLKPLVRRKDLDPSKVIYRREDIHKIYIDIDPRHQSGGTQSTDERNQICERRSVSFFRIGDC